MRRRQGVCCCIRGRWVLAIAVAIAIVVVVVVVVVACKIG
jgi:hypothetical protein